MTHITRYCLLAVALFSIHLNAQNKAEGTQIAFLADVHLQDLYGSLSDSDYKGVLNPANGKPALLRTMDAQLHSTRIFNENYFAFLAALDDIAKRNIHYVALPGDYSDDGQPLHVRGLQRILNEYSTKYNIEFFITTGNHDPVGPFAQDAGKDDFLGDGGKRQPIFSKEGYKPNPATELPVVLTKDIAKMGYLGITDYLQEFGFYPKANYKYWATPFSSYTFADYTLDKAQQASDLKNRMYNVAPGFTLPDVSYVVEPIDGLWLLAIDGNVYIPKNANGSASDPKNYKGADLGYNNVLSNKKHLIDWVKKIADEAKKQGKTLIAFSHYPMVEFNDDASPEIEALMGKGKWQLDRVPEEEVAQTFADAGLKIHFGGHMHINDTGIRTSAKGNTLVNVQTPSLAAYIPAYKLLTIKPNNVVEIETITIDSVPRFNELFSLYKMEHAFLESQHTKDIWNDAILTTKSYHEFTDYHLKELVRLRFLPDDWPVAFKEFITNVSGYDLLALANMDAKASYNDILKNKAAYKADWKKAETSTAKLLAKNKIKASDFKAWNGMDLITDFYRIRSADQLAIADVGEARIKQYQLLCASYLNKKGDGNDANQKNLTLFLQILDKFLKGAPANHFSVNLTTGAVQDLQK
ncbi:metallophosphoesterase family protein [Flavobacterium subsaxonicum]|uniref:Metallophosphatase n=1 Tax=Flavobacterium subsaxonicum WB 4.1-42 = DSM 21790 TaxID=1121898 RepID=A0A0A2MK39_9FLAO|nr:metallophosphoesterase [Flavobacterium subsaxonicum]KGO91853.1 metallophosphatase [Flavobacterium subsaxonicum WB 4.1-42 = DSM 21790]